MRRKRKIDKGDKGTYEKAKRGIIKNRIGGNVRRERGEEVGRTEGGKM